jgi:hypothetical protein
MLIPLKKLTASVLLLPFQIVQILSQSKSFKTHPVIGNRVLNILGLHALRYMTSHIITQIRWLQLRHLVTKDQRLQFHRDGFLIIENFLSAQEFGLLNQEVRQAQGEVRQCIQGDTCTQRILLDEKNLEPLPQCKALTRNRRFQKLLQYTGTARQLPLMYIQAIKNGFGAGKQDPQKNLHSDTFHPTMKAWLFLDTVTPEKGPFTYIPGSQQFSWRRLKWEYKQSCRIKNSPDVYSAKGSLRLNSAGASEMKLNAPRAFAVSANTLVIANTHGFHSRGQAQPRQSRLEIWCYSRLNPFNPWAGIRHWQWVMRLQHKIINQYLERQDRKKTRPSWHLIDQEEFHRHLDQ